MLPIASVACLWCAVVSFCRGCRMLVIRLRHLKSGLHATGVLPRPHKQGNTGYVPVFTYTTSEGEEVDIPGNHEYTTGEEALQARRPLVYEHERPDAAMASNAMAYIMRPILLFLTAAVLAAASCYLLQVMPD